SACKFRTVFILSKRGRFFTGFFDWNGFSRQDRPVYALPVLDDLDPLEPGPPQVTFDGEALAETDLQPQPSAWPEVNPGPADDLFQKKEAVLAPEQSPGRLAQNLRRQTRPV